MKKINLAVLMGGPSAEHEISLKSGRMILASLNKHKYRVLPIIISKKGEWQFGFVEGAVKIGIPEALKELKKRKIDCVFLALHGPFGEDGRIQALLELINIPYTGSGVLASALAMDKAATKKILAKDGILIPKYFIIKKDDFNKRKRDYFLEFQKEKIRLPIIIKPLRQGSSFGISIIRKNKDFLWGLNNAFRFDSAVLVEEFIEGREITATVLGNHSFWALPLIEIKPKISIFFDFKAKYQKDGSEEICPAPLDKNLTIKIQKIAIKAHQILGCRGVTRSDFILKENKPYFLEINTIPGMTETSLVPQAAQKAGLSFTDLLDKIIELALER